MALAMEVVSFGALVSCRSAPRPEPHGDEPAASAAAPSTSAASAAAPAVSPGGRDREAALVLSSLRDPECGPTPEYLVRAGSNLTPLQASLGEERGEVTLVFEKGRRRRVPERPVPGKPAVVAEHDEHDVTLLVVRGKKEVRIPLGSETGSFDAVEARCWARPRAVTPNPDLELTRISFAMGGWAGFVVRLLRPGLLQVVHFSGPDGKCSDVGIQRTEIRRIEVPTDVTFVAAVRATDTPLDGGAGCP